MLVSLLPRLLVGLLGLTWLALTGLLLGRLLLLLAGVGLILILLLIRHSDLQKVEANVLQDQDYGHSNSENVVLV